MKTAGYVVDASIATSWVLTSQATPLANRILAEIRSGTAFIVPSLWFLEVANTLLLLQRRAKLGVDECAHARVIINRLRPVVDDEGALQALPSVWQLASELQLTIYDAMYLELAIRRGAVLASRDGELVAAAKKRGVPILS
jgi:predicted nucleic acid-binding protein